MSRYLSFASVFSLLLIVSCQKEKSFEQGKLSKGSLQGNFGDCLAKTINGIYTATKSLADTNYIEVDVDVTETGRYSIYTDTVNGYFFRAEGTFSTVGSNTIRMKGFGTPASEGTDDFTVFYDSSFCNISVTVASSTGGGSTSPSTDYFPLTQNSYWTYDDGAGGDTLKTTISGTASKGGKTYQQFVTTYESGPPNDTSLYRKDASGSYYTFVDTSGIGALGLSFPQAGFDVLFLKSSLTAGATWNADFSATLSGIPVTVRFKFTCTNANTSITVNGVTYNNVYQVTSVFQLGAAGTFTDVFSLPDSYYAKGVGLIRSSDQFSGDQDIRYYQIL